MKLDISPRIGRSRMLLSQELKELLHRVNLAREAGIFGTALLQSAHVINGLIFAELGPIEGAFHERHFNSMLAKLAGSDKSVEQLGIDHVAFNCVRASVFYERQIAFKFAYV